MKNVIILLTVCFLTLGFVGCNNGSTGGGGGGSSNDTYAGAVLLFSNSTQYENVFGGTAPSEDGAFGFLSGTLSELKTKFNSAIDAYAVDGDDGLSLSKIDSFFTEEGVKAGIISDDEKTQVLDKLKSDGFAAAYKVKGSDIYVSGAYKE